MKPIITLLSVVALLATGCWRIRVVVPPVPSCLVLGFGGWSGNGPEGLAGRREALPDFQLTPDRADWPRDEVWYEVRTIAPRQPMGTPGRAILIIWLTPTPDSLVLFRSGEAPWALYVAGTWDADTLRGRADYWERGLQTREGQADAYAIRYDCSAFEAVAAASRLSRLLTNDVLRRDAAGPLSARALRLRFP